VVGTLGIEGVPGDEAKQLSDLIRLEPGQPFQRSTMFEGVEAIRRHYVKRDRLQARVESHATPSEVSTGVVDVRYEVEPGPEIQLRFEGLKKKEELARIRRDFQERGFYAVDVHYTPRGEGDDQEIEFEIDRGKSVRVQGILITGASQVPEERIRKQMLTRPPSLIGGAPFNPEVLDEDVSAIRNLYLDQGFLEIRIDEPRVWLSAAGDSVEISMAIDEGQRFAISEIEFSGEQLFEREQLLDWCALIEGEPFSTSGLLEAESGLRRGFDRDGYPDAKIRGNVEVGSSQVLVRFEIDPGVQKRLSGFRITGNEMTKESIIRREVKLSDGDLISREELLRGQHRLYRLGIFRNVRVGYEPAGNGDPNAYLVHVDVEEQRPVSLAIGVGYNTEADFKFSFATSYDNLNGKARSIGFQGEFSGILERLQLLGRSPRLFGANVPALGNLLWEREEKEGFTVERRSAALRVDRRLNPRWRGFLRYNLQRVDLLDVLDPGAPAEEREEDIILGDVGTGLFRITRDSLLLPTQGNYLELGFRFFAKPLLSEATFIKAQLTESQMWTFRNGTAFVTVFRVGFAPPLGDTEEVPISERFFAGGDSTNRGFGRDELGPKTMPGGVPLGGEGLLLFNEEFRFPIWRRIRLKGTLFYDAGNVYLTLSDFDPTDLRHTLGGGLRLETPIGPIRAEYGWKLDREEGESSGQFHFAIGAVY
jgi:outer membrane protein insertion porin family